MDKGDKKFRIIHSTSRPDSDGKCYHLVDVDLDGDVFCVRRGCNWKIEPQKLVDVICETLECSDGELDRMVEIIRMKRVFSWT